MINKKLLAISTIFLMLSNNITANELHLTDDKLLELKKTVKAFGRSNITVADGLDMGKYYFLQLNVKNRRGIRTSKAFVDKESGSVYMGERYDKNGTKMIFPKTKKGIATIKDGISFSYGSGKKDLYVVTDPECPYCIKFETEAEGKLDDYRVHVILYPLYFHKKAPLMTEWVLQGKDDAEKHQRLNAVMVKKSIEYSSVIDPKVKTFKYTKSTQVVVNKALAAVSVLGATGTPTVYNDKFEKINWKSLVTPKTAIKK